MRILYSWLKDYMDIKESPEKLADLLSVSSFEMIVDKKMGKDAVLEVSLLPNRVADASSHFGVARETALVKGKKLDIRDERLEGSAVKLAKTFSLEVEAPRTLVRRYMLAGMTGVEVKESPGWLKKRLIACGLRPINNIVDAANYVMLEFGQPLHAFDADGVSGRKIIVRKARKGEKIETIERKTYMLSGSETLIADKSGPLALAGVKGGKKGEISGRTKNIVIESANFDPISTRQTSRLHGLKTDASWRFENDLDPNGAAPALNRALKLIQEVAGGEILSGTLDFYPVKVLPRPVAIEPSKISKLIGHEIPVSRMLKLAAPFCESIEKGGKDRIIFHVKTCRRDLKYSEDIAEEIARLIGYNSIKPKLPFAFLIPPAKNEIVEFRERLKDEFVSLGFSETCNYSFIGERDAELLAIDRSRLVEIGNPVSRETKYLRWSLFPNIMKNIANNLRFFPEVRIFEVGKHYDQMEKGACRESWGAGGAVARKNADIRALFFEAKGAIESFMERLGFERDDYRFRESGGPWVIPGAAAAVFVGDKEIAAVGAVRPDTAALYGIDCPVIYLHIVIDALQNAVSEEHEFEPLHKYPDVARDISILVPIFTKVEDVDNVISEAGAKYLEDVDLFDIYEGDDLPDGKTSMAFHLVFRAEDRTLTDEEAGRELERIIGALKQFGAEIR